jgi:hypothetical protein
MTHKSFESQLQNYVDSSNEPETKESKRYKSPHKQYRYEVKSTGKTV